MSPYCRSGLEPGSRPRRAVSEHSVERSFVIRISSDMGVIRGGVGVLLGSDGDYGETGGVGLKLRARGICRNAAQAQNPANQSGMPL